MRRRFVFTIALAFISACVPRDRLNTDCQWINDAPAALDLTNAAQRTHLRLDVIVAEELAVRFADARTAAPRAAVREECLARLFPEIGRAHRVTIEQVVAERGRREGLWDILVFAIFAAAYAAASLRITDRVRQPFRDSPRAAWLALFVAAVPVAVVGMASGEIWVLLAEGVRVSNLSHLSGFRGNRVPWRHHRAEIFAVCLALFWMVALARTALLARRQQPQR
jgi:hypothetical protein